MNRCPISYELCGVNKYSPKGLNTLSPKLRELANLEYTQEELVRESAARATKLSIQGVQPKLSAKLSVAENKFEIVDRYGTYILKPQNYLYPELPQNEDLSMRLAKVVQIEVPVHGMVYSKDGQLVYFIKRFDRLGKSKKLSVEDFAQLAGRSRETKYDYSMEKIVTLIDNFCTFPAIEKAKLFKLSVFNFLIGNEDMHLKNYSIINRNDINELAPAYDLLNSTIANANAQEEIALPLNGKKRKLKKMDLINYWGEERLQLPSKIIASILNLIYDSYNSWNEQIEISFLSAEMKKSYSELLEKRRAILQ